MDLTLIVVAVVGGALLGGMWLSHLRRDLRRRSARSSEWEGDQGLGDLWTTAARCPECEERGALLRRQDRTLWHTCMACGHQHMREHRG